MLVQQKIQKLLAGQGTREHSVKAGGNEKWCCHFGTSLADSYKTIPLLCDLAVVFLGICPNELKTCIHTETCMWMFNIYNSFLHMV